MKIYKHYSAFPKKDWRWPSFSPQEMACRGDANLAINEDAMDKLQALRELLDRPVIVNSAYRSPSYNKRIGGAKKSQHLNAKAFDISMTNQEPAKFEAAARKVGFTGFGFYKRSNFIHVDTGREREWGNRWFSKGDKALSNQPETLPETIKGDKDLIGTGIGAGGLVTVLTQIFPALSGLSESAQIIAVAGLGIAGLAIAYVLYRKMKKHA